MSVADWSATADENTSIDGINIAEHCPAKNINNAIRSVMAALKNKCDTLDATDNTLRRGAVIGEVRWFAMSTPPEAWLVCNGAAVGRATYHELFAAIGTTYGAGNGSTTFNLPNLVDKFVEGSATAGTVKSAGLPNITGILKSRPESANGSLHGGAVTGAKGAFSVTFKGDGVGEYGLANVAPSYNNDLTTFDASRSNSIYGKSSTVQPPALCLLPCIRYE